MPSALAQRRKKTALTLAEEAELLMRLDAGMSQTAIEAEFGVSRNLTRRIIRKWKDGSEAVRRYLLSRQLGVAVKQVESILGGEPNRDTYEMATDLLERCGTINPKPQPRSSPQPVFQVHVGRVSNLRQREADE